MQPDSYILSGANDMRQKITAFLAMKGINNSEKPLELKKDLNEPHTLRLIEHGQTIVRLQGVVRLHLRLTIGEGIIESMEVLRAEKVNGPVQFPPSLNAQLSQSGKLPSGNGKKGDTAAEAAAAFMENLTKTTQAAEKPKEDLGRFEKQGGPLEAEVAFRHLLEIEQARERAMDRSTEKMRNLAIAKEFATRLLSAMGRVRDPSCIRTIAKALSLGHQSPLLRRNAANFLDRLVSGNITEAPLQKDVKSALETARALLRIYVGEENEEPETGGSGKRGSVAEGLRKLTEATSRTVQQAGFNMILDTVEREATRPPRPEAGPEGQKRTQQHDATLLKAVAEAQGSNFYKGLSSTQRKQAEQQLNRAREIVDRRRTTGGKLPPSQH